MPHNRFSAWAITAALLANSAAEAQNNLTAKTVTIYTGEVNARTADRFLSTMADNVDRVIGVKVIVEPSTDADFDRNRYLAHFHDDQLVISKSNSDEGGIEVVKSGPVQRMWAMYSIDGMFIVKPGGLNQGVASFGLEPVDEATVRLNPAVRIIEQPF